MAIPLILMTVLVNVFIATTVGGMVMLQLLAFGYNNYGALVISVVVAILVNVYIFLYGRIRNFIKGLETGDSDDEHDEE
jgi:hypothetical protein